MIGRVVISLTLLSSLVACSPTSVSPIVPAPDEVATEEFEQVVNSELDLLVVIDDSGSMGEEQFSLMAQLAAFIEILEATGAVINVASVTTDAVNNPDGAFFISPQPTIINGQLARDIPQAFCDGVIQNSDNGLLSNENVALTNFIDTFGQIQDFTGREIGVFQDADNDKIADNLVTASFADAFGCLISVNTQGNGAEAGLCQAAAALDQESLATTNSGFLQNEESILAILYIGDEDDCGETFTVEQVNGLERFSCAVPALQQVPGSLVCSQSVQEANLCGVQNVNGKFEDLNDVAVYADRVKAVRPEQRLFIATVVGPPGNSVSNCNANLPVPTCFNADTGSASPGNRFFQFANSFENKLDALDIAQGICGDFGNTISEIGENLGALLNAGCLNAAPKGNAEFSDPAKLDAFIQEGLKVFINIENAIDVVSCDQIVDGLGQAVSVIKDGDNPQICEVIDNLKNLTIEEQAGCAGGFELNFEFEVPLGSLLSINYTVESQ